MIKAGKSRVVVSLMGDRNPGNTRGAVTAVDRVLHRSVAGKNGCVVYTGSQGGGGYGRVKVGPRNRPTHRVVYEALVGPIPDGLVLDHLCRNRACVNPHHLEPVTQQENVLRGQGLTAAQAAQSECLRGHAFTDANTLLSAKGERRCRTCQRDHDGRKRAVTKAAAECLGISLRNYIATYGQAQAVAWAILDAKSTVSPGSEK